MKHLVVDILLILATAAALFVLIPFSITLAVNNKVESSRKEFRSFLNAIAKVESNCDDNAVGDNGKSLGRYQISRAYWYDACERDPNLLFRHKWEDVTDPIYAEAIMESYWARYVTQAYLNKDYEILARVHNGGPRGYKKDSTILYWNKIKKELQL